MGKRSRSPKTRRRPSRRGAKTTGSLRRGLFRLGLKLALGLIILLTGYVAWLDLKITNAFEGKRWAVPARIFARPLTLYPSVPISVAELILELERAGYQQVNHPIRPGQFTRRAGEFEILTRAFRFWDSIEPARHINVKISKDAVASLSDADGEIPIVRLDPALIGRILPTHEEDRILVARDEVPPLLIDALIAVEDRDFYEHFGVSIRGIARAMMVNLRAGATVQGGSTLTQQLAKNFFLRPDRQLGRKLNEIAIALILEFRFSKDEILTAYLNEIFLGQQGGRSIHGFGSASYHYFSRPLAELETAELAMLVGLARGASYYNPRRHPERALERRNLVLSTMQAQGMLSQRTGEGAKATRLGVTRKAPPARTMHPAFVTMVRRQLRVDYHKDDLRGAGLRVFTTLAPTVQRQAETALETLLPGLETKHGIASGELQGAIVVTDKNSGEVLAVVGDRKPQRNGFNRALDASRPVGSIIKPAVYLAALEQPDRYTLVTPIVDERVEVLGENGELWSPANYDRHSHGEVALLTALAQSYNQATVNLGLSLGVNEVLEVVRRLGCERQIPPYPSILLGSVAMTPVEVAGIYQTLSSGGFKTALRAIREVTDSQGNRLSRYALTVHQSFQPEPVYLLNRALQEVMRTGTGRGAMPGIGKDLAVAGKTGTTNDLRDSWFAGFDNQYLTVVWLGRDNNKPTGLTGASGALTIWSELMRALHPRSLRVLVPEGVDLNWTIVAKHRRTDPNCPNAVRLPFIRKNSPRLKYEPCHLVDQATVVASDITTSAFGGVTSVKE